MINYCKLHKESQKITIIKQNHQLKCSKGNIFRDLIYIIQETQEPINFHLYVNSDKENTYKQRTMKTSTLVLSTCLWAQLGLDRQNSKWIPN